MKSRPALSSNFAHLQSHDEQLLRLGMLAERYFSEDPNTCLLNLRQLPEVLAQLVASNVGILDHLEDGQYELLSRLRDHGILPYEIHQLFGEVRRTGNSANHALAGDHRTALAMRKISEQQEIVRRVEDLFAFADRIEARLATAQKTVEHLTPATLSKAFRGELVPQDPNDEPASALLERLSTSTPSAPTKSQRAGKRRGPKL